MTREEILTGANIAEKYRADCFITDGGTIFMPQINMKTEEIEKTGADVYADYQAALENPPVAQPTAADILGQQVTALTLANGQKDTLIQQLGAQVVQMQLDIATLKGSAS
jgi:hypothetical protein